MKVAIFAGPSLSEKKYDFTYLPPLKHANLVSFVEEYKPDIVGIADDYTGRYESVWHNEIIYILEKGIKIFGAGGIGAVRAAELENYGMIGVGEVFKFFKNNLISSDDEVISLFDENNNFQRITEPLINIRFTFEKIFQDKELKEEIFNKIRNIYWKERTMDKVLNCLPDDSREQFKNSYIDIQKEDTLNMLNTIKNSMKPDNIKEDKSSINNGNLFKIVFERDRQVKTANGETTLNNIANYAILKHEKSEELLFNSLNREIVAFFAEYLNIEVSENELEEEIKRFKKNIDDFDKWLKENSMAMFSFKELMKKNVLCRKMHKWFIAKKKYLRTTSVVNEQLVLNNEFIEYKEKAIEIDNKISEQEIKDNFDSYSIIDLIVKLKQIYDFDFPWNVSPVQGAIESGFSKNDFKSTLLKLFLYSEKESEKILSFLK